MRPRKAYEHRILKVEQSTFTPLIFAAICNQAKQSTTFYKRLASLLADKWEHPYKSTLSWLRCLLLFSLLRSAFQCIRGACSSCGHASRSPLNLVSAEAHLSSGLQHYHYLSNVFIYIYFFLTLCLYNERHGSAKPSAQQSM